MNVNDWKCDGISDGINFWISNWIESILWVFSVDTTTSSYRYSVRSKSLLVVAVVARVVAFVDDDKGGDKAICFLSRYHGDWWPVVKSRPFFIYSLFIYFHFSFRFIPWNAMFCLSVELIEWNGMEHLDLLLKIRQNDHVSWVIQLRLCRISWSY